MVEKLKKKRKNKKEKLKKILEIEFKNDDFKAVSKILDEKWMERKVKI